MRPEVIEMNNSRVKLLCLSCLLLGQAGCLRSADELMVGKQSEAQRCFSGGNVDFRCMSRAAGDFVQEREGGERPTIGSFKGTSKVNSAVTVYTMTVISRLMKSLSPRISTKTSLWSDLSST